MSSRPAARTQSPWSVQLVIDQDVGPRLGHDGVGVGWSSVAIDATEIPLDNGRFSKILNSSSSTSSAVFAKEAGASGVV